MAELPLAIVDPYGGTLETWPASLLNDAGMRSNLVLDEPVVRPVPRVNQITLRIAEHWECCGPDCLGSIAYAAGLVDDAVRTILDAVHWIEATFHQDITHHGTATEQLQAYARHRGWACHIDSGAAGDVSVRAYAAGKVAVIALHTAYTKGLWNVLHPQPHGPVPHFEVGGCVNGVGRDIAVIAQEVGPDMTANDYMAILTAHQATCARTVTPDDPTLASYNPHIVQACEERVRRIMSGQTTLQDEVNAIEATYFPRPDGVDLPFGDGGPMDFGDLLGGEALRDGGDLEG